MKKEKFNIRTIDHALLEIEGYTITNHKFAPEVKLVVHKDLDICGNEVPGRWVVTELESGTSLVRGATRQKAIAQIDEFSCDKEKILSRIAEFVEEYGKAN